MTKSKKMNQYGLIASAAWLITLAVLAYSKRANWAGMALNEIGDFVGGGFGPLAFLWLVLGYYQSKDSLDIQAKELQASVNALELQAKELKASVEAQQELVKVAEAEHKSNLASVEEQRQHLREQREAERHRAQPIFVIKSNGYSTSGPSQLQHSATVTNAGAEATNVHFLCEAEDARINQEVPYFERGKTIQTALAARPNPRVMERLLRVDYLDRDGNPGNAVYEIAFRGNGPVMSPYFTRRLVGNLKVTESGADTISTS